MRYRSRNEKIRLFSGFLWISFDDWSDGGSMDSKEKKKKEGEDRKWECGDGGREDGKVNEREE